MGTFLMAGAGTDQPERVRSRTAQIILAELPEGRFGLQVDQIESIEELRTEGADFQGKKRSWYRGALLEMIEPQGLMEDINRRLDPGVGT